MHDDADLRRLAEMGIKVYRLRGTPAAAREDATAPRAAARAMPADAAPVLLLAADGSDDHPVLSAVGQALAFARVGSVCVKADDIAARDDARALVVFGQALARALGARLSAQRQAQIDWVVTSEPAALRGDALAKRALWGELRRIMRRLHAAAR